MLLHSGGTRRLLNPAQRQPESNLLLEPAKQNRHIFSAPISRRKERFFCRICQKESPIASFGRDNLSYHLLRSFHVLLSLTQHNK